jgi:hypothetical protein
MNPNNKIGAILSSLMPTSEFAFVANEALPANAFLGSLHGVIVKAELRADGCHNCLNRVKVTLFDKKTNAKIDEQDFPFANFWGKSHKQPNGYYVWLEDGPCDGASADWYVDYPTPEQTAEVSKAIRAYIFKFINW